jgi:tetratricopeptide (TPR) repeat protein
VSAADRSRAVETIEKATRISKAGQHDEALQLLEALQLDSLPDDLASLALFTRGEIHFRKGLDASKEKILGVSMDETFQQSRKCYQEVVQKYPNEEKTGSAAYLLGSCSLMLNDYARARGEYQKAFDEYPQLKSRSRALLRVGVCLASVGKVSEARAVYNRVIREFPQRTADVNKARKYLHETGIVGKKAPRLHVDQWLFGVAGEGGLESFQGEAIFLVFFATWCENCSAELPHLRRLYRHWSDAGLVFLGVANPNDPANTSPVDVYVQKNSMEFHDVALDGRGASWSPYHVSRLPACVLIDRRGNVVWRGHPSFFPTPLVERVLSEG